MNSLPSKNISKKCLRLLGVKLSPREFTQRRVSQLIKEALGGQRQASQERGEVAFGVTLNPEILLAARTDTAYRQVLNQADLPVIDGFGIQLVAWLRGLRTGQRWAGADLTEEVLRQAEERGLRVALIVRKDGLSSSREVLRAVKQKFPGASFSVLALEVQNNWKKEELQKIAASPELKNAEALLVGLGAPFQEKLIGGLKNRFQDQLSQLKLALGVGGTFDFWTRRQRRAPGWLRKLGLEWLWRIAVQPENRLRRAKRIFRAVVVFPVLGLFEGVNKFFQDLFKKE
jgi:N-acetylglucosaminyldiphosphoundecaprenol N-acetyl-beta-D-mannosaminyltransferase